MLGSGTRTVRIEAGASLSQRGSCFSTILAGRRQVCLSSAVGVHVECLASEGTEHERFHRVERLSASSRACCATCRKFSLLHSHFSPAPHLSSQLHFTSRFDIHMHFLMHIASLPAFCEHCTEDVNAASRIQPFAHLPCLPSRMQLSSSTRMSLVFEAIYYQQIP
jgi:hypothetical protein